MEFIVAIALWCTHPVNTKYVIKTAAQVNECRDRLIKCTEEAKKDQIEWFKKEKL